MKLILKIIGVLFGLYCLYFLSVMGQICLIEGKHLLYPYIDTHFAKNYSPEKFKKIKFGMNLNDVLNLIGEPINKRDGEIFDSNIVYDYTADGKAMEIEKNNFYYDFAWYRSSVGFDSEGIVVYINKGWSYD